MTRAIKKRFRVYAELEATSPIHAGGMGNNALVDLPLAVNGQGRYYIPGTSLAGALRNWMWENLGQVLTENLWGSILKSGDDKKGSASFILVEDSVLPENAIAEIRDGVGIDRHRGAAADKIKFDRAIIPRGTVFPLELTVEIPALGKPEETEAKAALDALIAALNSEEIRLGAAKSRGLGRVKIKEKAKLLEEKLDSAADILKVIKQQVEKHSSHQFGRDYCLPQNLNYLPKLIFDIAWQPKDPVMVKAEADGLAVNILPLTSSIDGFLALTLPGSSLKGALRFQAERIVRTLGVREKIPVTNQDNSSSEDSTSESQINPAKQQFFSRLELPLIVTLFGTGKSAENNGKFSKEPMPGLSALVVEDCYGNLGIKSEQWQAIAQATNSEELQNALKALTEAGLSETQQAYHVAVDRWTGGAAKSMLYSALEPFGVEWQPLRLTLNLNRIPENERLCAIALLLLTLRDLSEGRIPLGYGVNRGMGALAVTQISIQGKGLDGIQPPILQALERGVNYTGTNIADLGEGLLQEIDRDWGAWIVCNSKEVPA
ncbi:RAMP superfamily CRISPR-associated protein [Microcoleus sp. B4-D4]|uniref:RAMP superfamily CRISPR-associated protein n=1 Tax=Microcoleus sp. B4-D4 TaxID=2818667 RepID=UPI002FD72146